MDQKTTFTAENSSLVATQDPAYIEVAEILRNELRQGSFYPGQQLPSVRNLMRRTGRSMATVRRGIELLVKDGLLELREREGIYVHSNFKRAKFQSHKTFLAVLPAFAPPAGAYFTSQLVAGMLDACKQADGDLLLHQLGSLDASGPEVLKRILDKNPHGVAWLHPYEEATVNLARLVDRGIPVVTSFRRFPHLPLPLVREDYQMLARLVMSALHEKGHRCVGVIIRQFGDEPYEARLAALNAEGAPLGIQINRDDCFDAYYQGVRVSPRYAPFDKEALLKFLQERPQLTCLLVLHASSIQIICELFQGPLAQRMRKISLIFNVDWMAAPLLPTGETLARIELPLEKFGREIIRRLDAAASGTNHDLPEQLLPVFAPGDSLRPNH